MRCIYTSYVSTALLAAAAGGQEQGKEAGAKELPDLLNPAV